MDNLTKRYQPKFVFKASIAFLFLSFICLLNSALSQTATERLQIKFEEYVAENGEDSVAISMLKQLYKHTNQAEPFLAIEYAGQALQIAQELEYRNSEAEMYTLIADIYNRQKVYYLSMDYYFKSYVIYNELGDSLNIADCYLNIGSTYNIQNVEEIALEYYEKAQKIFKNAGDNDGLARTLDHIGKVHVQQERYDMALQNFIKAKQYRDSVRDVSQIAQSHNNIASVYIEDDEYDLALKHLKESLILYKIEDDKYKVADTYLLYGTVYMREQNYEMAVANFEKALLINLDLNRDVEISNVYNKLASIALSTKTSEAAIELAEKSIDYNPGNLEHLQESYLILSNAYEQNGDLDNALQNQRSYAMITNEIFSEKRKAQFTEMQVSLELQRQDKEIEILKRDQEIQNQALKRSRLGTYFLLAGLVFIILFAGYYFSNSRKMKKANDLLTRKNEEINRQKEEITHQKEELGVANEAITYQKEEIQRKNKNITASINYASRIQNALLPDIREFKKILPESFIFLRPKEVISGDFYWFERKRHQGKSVIAAVDCTGHGVPGAIMSMLGDAFLNQIVNVQNITEADQILNQLHKLIRKALKQEYTDNRDGMDMSLCVIDKHNKRIEFAGAKNPVFFIQHDKISQIKGDNTGIGGMQREKSRKFSKQTLEFDLDTPAYIYMFSDGFQDQFGGPDNFKFTRKQFRDFILSIHKHPMEEQARIIENKLDQWRGDIEQLDDVLIIGMKIIDMGLDE